MEDSCAKDQPLGSALRPTSRLLRYPLRSAAKSKEEKPPLSDSTNSDSVTKRERLTSTVSKSVSVLDLSSKENSAKPPRRLSVPSKSNIVPTPKSLGDVTPISEARARSAVSQGKNFTPSSDVSRPSSTRRRFNMLSSASYWLSQIRLAESAAKHSVALGFFKLALEAGCEHIHRMREELKSYAQRHDLAELGQCLKELFESYKITENFESLQVSGNSSQVAEDFSEVNGSSSSVTGSDKSLAKSLDINADASHEEDEPEKKTRTSVPKKVTYPKSISEVKGQKKPQKQIKKESNPDKDKVKKQGKKPAPNEDSEHVHSLLADEAIKENKAARQVEESFVSKV